MVPAMTLCGLILGHSSEELGQESKCCSSDWLAGGDEAGESYELDAFYISRANSHLILILN